MKSNKEFIDSVYQKVDKAREEERIKKQKLRRIYKWTGSVAACLVIGIFALGQSGMLQMGSSGDMSGSSEACIDPDYAEAQGTYEIGNEKSDISEWPAASSEEIDESKGSINSLAPSDHSSSQGAAIDNNAPESGSFISIEEVIVLEDGDIDSYTTIWNDDEDKSIIRDWLDELGSENKLTADEFSEKYPDGYDGDSNYYIVTDDEGAEYYIINSTPPIVS